MTTAASVQCNQCGAPLQVEDATRFVTCAHCGASLEVKRTGTSRFTSVLERLDRRTEDMAGNLEAIRLQNELERLDREWEVSRRQFATTDKHGNVHYPGQPAQAVGGIVAAVFGVLWTILACAFTGSAPNDGPMPVVKIIFPLFGLVFVIAAVAGIFKNQSSATAYRDAEAAYNRQRETVRRQMSALGSGIRHEN